MNASQYLKNVGKSLGYIAVDSFKQMNPNITAVYDNAKEFTSDLYQTIDDFTYKFKGSGESSLNPKSKVKSTATEIWTNARDDFLSGKWYNKERKEAAEMETYKAMGLDFSFDMDFDFEDEDISTSNKSDQTELEQSQKETEAIIGTVNSSVAAAANSIVAANARSTDYLASMMTTNMSALYDLNHSGFNAINSGMAAINQNISALVTLGKPLTDHMQNSALFYSKSTEFQNKALELLTQIAKNTGGPEKKTPSRKRTFESYVGEGGIDLAGLFSDMKEDASKTIKEYKELLDMMGGVGGLGKDYKASPISTLLTKLLIPSLIPRSTKGKIKNINDYIGVLGFNEFNKASKAINDSPLGLILDVLGINIPSLDLKKTVNTKNYNQGKAFWTGRSEKALQEVIPYYLAKMTAIIDGSGKVEIFDYKNGRFTTREQIQADYDREKNNRAASASYYLTGRVSGTYKKGYKDVSKEEINELSSLLILEGGDDYYLLFSSNRSEREKYIREHDEIRQFLKDHPNVASVVVGAASKNPSGARLNKYDVGKYVESIGRGKIATSKAHSEYEETGQFDLLFNNSTDINKDKFKNGGIIGGSDKYGNTALDYLRGIYINTSGGIKKSNSNYNSNKAKFADVSLPGFVVEQEQKEAQDLTSAAISSIDKSTEELVSSLKSEYGDAWDSITKDAELKAYLISKEREKSKGNSEYFQEDSTLESKAKAMKISSKVKGYATKFAKDTGLADKIGSFVEKMGEIAATPANLVNKVIDLVQSTLHDMIFSKAGLFGWLFDKENGKLRPALSNIGKSFKNLLFGGADAEVTAVPNAYNGGYVRRTGLAAVSEGEMIIPAEFNPYYTGRVDKSRQRRDENNAIMRFFGSYQNGTASVGQNQTKSSGGLVGVAGNVLEKGFVDFGHLLFKTFSGLIGLKGDPKGEKEERDKIAGIIGKATDAIKEHAGDAMVGGMIGGGISLLTGGVISPILAASLGAATGLIMSSNKLKDFLFGNDEEQGKIFKKSGPKIRNFIEEQLPTSLMGGALGGIGGALTGHPVLGMFLGAGIGFVSKSQSVQRTLFGDKDIDGNRTGGLISKELQDKFKTAMPGMSAGAITGLVTTALVGGPFGIVGNMLLGAGVGALSTSEKFKEWLLGEEDAETGERKGGLVKDLRERMIDPTREMFFNLGDRIRQDFREIAIGFFDRLKSISKIVAESTILEKLKGVSLKGFDWINGKLAKIGIELPKHVIPNLTKPSNWLKAKNLAGGYLEYDKSGRALTAAERLNNFSTLGIKDKLRGKTEGSFGYQVAKLLAGDQDENGGYQGLSRDKLNSIFSDLNKLKGASPEDRAKIIQNNPMLASLGIDNLDDAAIRKLKDSVKVELGAKPKNIIIQDIKNTTSAIKTSIAGKDGIAENLKKILDFGVPERKEGNLAGGDRTLSEGSAATNAGQAEKKKQEEYETSEEKIRQAIEEINENSRKANERLFGTDSSNRNDNDKETKKNGILGKLFGDDSVIGKAASMITKVGSAIGAMALGVLGLLSTGWFDKIAAKLNIGWGGANNSTVTNATTGATTTISNIYNYITGKDKTVGGAGEEGGKSSDITVSTNDAPSLSDLAKGTLARQGFSLLPEVIALLTKQVDDVILNLSKIKSFKVFGNMANALDALKEGLIGTKGSVSTAGFLNDSDGILVKAVKKLGFKDLQGALKTIGTVVTWIFVVTDFTSGMQDAESTMKVVNPSIPERIVCGVLRVIKNDIPIVGIIGGLVPDSALFSLVNATIGAALGLKDGIDQRRAEAQAELDAFNEKTGLDFTWDQYVKDETHGGLGKKSWTTRIGESVKTGALRTVDAITHPGQHIMNSLNAFKEGFQNTEGNLYTKFMGGTAEFQDEFLPGIIGNMSATMSRVWVHAATGDIQNVWKENTEFLGKNNDVISNLMGAIVNSELFALKIAATPVALVNKLIYNIRDGFKEFDFGDNPFASLAEDYLNINLHAFAGDMKEMWAYKPNLNTKNKLIEGIWNVAMTTQKVVNTPFTAITWLIKKVWNGFDTIKDSVTTAFSSSFESLATPEGEIGKNVAAGDVKGLWSTENPTKGEGGLTEGLGNVLTFSMKVVETPYTAAVFLGRKAADFITDKVTGMKKGFDYVKKESEKAVSIVHSKHRSTSDVSSLLNVPDPEEGTSLPGIFKAAAVGGRIVVSITEAVKAVAYLVDEKIIKPMVDKFGPSFMDIKNDIVSLKDEAFKPGNIVDFAGRTSSVSDEHPLIKKIGDMALGLAKNVLMTPKVLVTAFDFISFAVKGTIDNGKAVFNEISTDATEIEKLANAGDVVGLIAYRPSAYMEGEPFWNSISDSIMETQKMFFAGKAALGWVGNKISTFFQNTVDKIKTAYGFYKGETEKSVRDIEDGKIENVNDLMKDLPIKDPSNPAEYFLNIATRIARLVSIPIVAVKATGGLVKSIFDRTKVAVKANSIVYKSGMETLKEIIDDDEKDVDDIMDFEPEFDESDPTYKLRSGIFEIAKMFYGSIKQMRTLGGKLKEPIQSAWQKLKDVVAAGDAEKAKNASNSGGGSGFVSQVDPRYAGMNLGNYNVGSMGCGPAAASMVLGNSMSSNVNLARKYQTAGGTDLAYFAEAFSRNGKRPVYYNLGGGASGQDMVYDIASGKPVVLMGRDPYNTSKRFSPFGPNNHYVVAKGFRNGGVVIDDPESPSGGRVYSTSILRNVKAAVSAGSSGLRRFRMTGIGGGSAMTSNGVAQQVWAYFKQ